MGDYQAAAPKHAAIPAMREFISSSHPEGQYLITKKGIRVHGASWLVIPYNALLAKSGLASALREIHAKWTKVFEIQGLERPRIPKLAGPSAGHTSEA